VADDLRRYLRGEPIRARPVGRWERAARWVKRRPLIAALLGVGVVVAALGFGGSMGRKPRIAVRGVSRRLAGTA
jgi:hypothetical protein